MDIREVEKELERSFSKLNKTFFGRGPQNICVRLTGNNVYIKVNMGFSEAESVLLERLVTLDDHHFINDMFSKFKDDYVMIVSSVLGKSVGISCMYCRPIPSEKCICYLVFFDENVEKLARNKAK